MVTSTRTAVIGCGYWGKNLIRNFAELGALEAVVDHIPELAEQYAQKYGVRALTLGEVLTSDDIDAVVIAAPAELHAELALQAFKAGKHVYVEKPIALSVDDGERMAEAAKMSNKTLMVGHLLQYHPAFAKLRAMVENGELGELRYAYSNRLSTGKFRLEENALWSLAPHDFSMILSLFNEAPSRVTGQSGTYITPGVEDMHHVDISFPSGAHAHIFVSWLHPFKEQKLVVVGEKAMVVFEDSQTEQEKKLVIYRHQIDTSGTVPVPIKADAEYLDYDMSQEPLKEECRHFIHCCANNVIPRTDAEEALAVLRSMVAAS